MRLERRVRDLVSKQKRKPLMKVKLPVETSPELCRVLGILHGDGNMSGRRVLLTDENRVFHRTIHKLFKTVFGIRMNLFHDIRRNSYYSYTKSVLVYRFLNEIMEMPCGPVRQNLKIPSYMEKLGLKHQAEYVGGLFDAEGCVKTRQAELNLSSTSKNIFKFIGGFLKKIGVTYSTYERRRHKNPEYEIYVYGKDDLKKFSRYVSFLHPLKMKRMAKFL